VNARGVERDGVDARADGCNPAAPDREHASRGHMKSPAWLLLGAVFAYLIACSTISFSRSRAYDSIKIGDGREAVVSAFGAAGPVELPDKPFTRYATSPCAGCRERVWFENRLSLDTEAWSVEFDEHDRVMRKTAWHSP